MKKLLVLLNRYLASVASLDDINLKGRLSTALIEYITTGQRPATDDSVVDAFLNLLEPEIIRTLLAVRHPHIVHMKQVADSPQSEKPATCMTNNELSDELADYVPEGETKEIMLDDGHTILEFKVPKTMQCRSARDYLIDAVIFKREVRAAAHRIFRYGRSAISSQ